MQPLESNLGSQPVVGGQRGGWASNSLAPRTSVRTTTCVPTGIAGEGDGQAIPPMSFSVIIVATYADGWGKRHWRWLLGSSLKARVYDEPGVSCNRIDRREEDDGRREDVEDLNAGKTEKMGTTQPATHSASSAAFCEIE